MAASTMPHAGATRGTGRSMEATRQAAVGLRSVPVVDAARARSYRFGNEREGVVRVSRRPKIRADRTQMARRRAGKADPKSAALRGGRRRGKAKAVAANSAPAPAATRDERLAALERECAVLREELERERARRQALEAVHAATRDRIAWALNSLQAILDARS